MVQVFEGLRVLDFSSGMAGGIASMVLADNGADVIKIEPPEGDPTRGMPAFRQWHRGQKSVVIDLKTDRGQEQAHRLATTADIVLESFRPGVAKRIGIGSEPLLRANPRLIHCSITGFRDKGRYARYKAYDALVQAKSGRMEWFRGQLSREGPAYAAVPVASFGASQLALQGIIAALYVRERTGLGQAVKTSLLDAVGCYDMFNWATIQLRERFPDNFRGLLTLGPSYHYLAAPTKDGRWLQFSNAGERQFQAFLRAVGMEEIFEAAGIAGQRLVSLGTTTEEFWELLLLRIQEKPYDEWMKIFLGDPNISAELFRNPEEAMEHPQVIHNRNVVEFEDPDVGKTKQLGVLVKFAETPSRIHFAFPHLGQHTEEVLSSADDRCTPAPSTHTSQPPHPLDGVTVLELAGFYAAPFSGSLLADLGARVIKIEPLEGDPMRGAGGTTLKTVQGKESLAVDMKADAGRHIIHRLVRHADLLFHNYRPGVPERLGMDYPTLQQINPNLVYLYAASYGSSGPYADRVAYHPTFGAICGGASAQAGNGTIPPPGSELGLDDVKRISRILSKANEGNPDPTSAMVAATALLMGLLARERLGHGQYLETTMLCSNAYANSEDFISYAGKPSRRLPDAECYGIHALYRLYQCAEGWIFLGCVTDREWGSLCKALSLQDLLTDERFHTAQSRLKHDHELTAVLGSAFRKRGAWEWEDRLTSDDIGCVVADAGEYCMFFTKDPHIGANAMAIEVDHPQWGRYLRNAPSVDLSLTPGKAGPAARVGEHTRSILSELGYNAAEIANLKALGAVTWPESDQ